MISLWGGRSVSEQPRRIGAGPTFDIVRLINRTHAGEELFKPYEHVDFGQRLSISRGYGWGDIYGRFADDRLVAVAGLWHGNVADYGYEAGCEDDMVALLNALIPVSQSAGNPNLTIFQDKRSPLYPKLTSDEHRALEFVFFAPRVEPPAQPRLLYVDPAYF
jgi:hypothetical protein